jgi:hypothetical protein
MLSFYKPDIVFPKCYESTASKPYQDSCAQTDGRYLRNPKSSSSVRPPKHTLGNAPLRPFITHESFRFADTEPKIFRKNIHQRRNDPLRKSISFLEFESMSVCSKAEIRQYTNVIFYPSH